MCAAQRVPLIIVALLSFAAPPASAAPAPKDKADRPDPPHWVEPMRKVHAKFTGRKGTFALFGDSITVSMAFWAGLPHDRKHMPPEGEKAFDLVNGHMLKECWAGWRGAAASATTAARPSAGPTRTSTSGSRTTTPRRP
jgi:hypothetical protein